MKSILIATFFLLLSLAYNQSTNADEFPEGLGVYDGKLWVDGFNELARGPDRDDILFGWKMWFLAGVYNGIFFSGPLEVANEAFSEIPSNNINTMDLVKAIDELYSDYRNKRIPIVLALKIVNMELSGVSKEKIDKYVRSLRAMRSKQ